MRSRPLAALMLALLVAPGSILEMAARTSWKIFSVIAE
jgi:hypothetical protein